MFRDISFGSFGAFIVITVIVMIIISEGEFIESFDIFDGGTEKKRQRKLKNHNTLKK